MSIEEGTRLFSDGKINAAINCFKAVVEFANVENNLVLKGRALGNLATCHAKIDQHEEAIPLYEQAIELLHDDNKRKLSLLAYLRDSYNGLQQHEKVIQLQSLIDKLNGNEISNPNVDICSANNKDTESKLTTLNSAKPKLKTKSKMNANKNMFSSFLSYFNQKGEPANIEEYMSLMAKLAGEQDINEEYFLQHLMQIHLKDLPFDVVEKRIKSVETSLNGLEGLLECFATIHYENALLFERANAGKAATIEGSGTFSHAIKHYEEYVQKMSLSNKDICKRISKQILEEFASMKIAYNTIVKELILRQQALASRAKLCEEAEFKAISHLATKQEEWVECLRAKDTINNGNSMSTSAKVPAISAAPSLDDFDLIMYEEYEADLNKHREEELQKSVELAKQNVQKSTELLTRARNDLKLGHETICTQLELVESQRIDAVKSMFKKLIQEEIHQLNEMKSSLSNLLERVTIIDRSSDLRTFCNNEFVKSYLNGDISRAKFIDERPDGKPLVDIDENMIERSVDDLFTSNKTSSNRKDEVSESNQCELYSLCDLFQKREYRYTFLRCLNKYRSKRTNVGSAFEKLVIILIAMLDASYMQGDVKSAKMILILAETFYRYKNNESQGKTSNETNSSDAFNSDDVTPEKEYVQNRIKGHAMWRSVAFWEEVFHQSVREEVERNFEVEKSGNGGLLLSTFQNIAYGQIYSCAFNMISCDVDQETVVLFVDRMCIANDLSCKQRQEILNGISKH